MQRVDVVYALIVDSMYSKMLMVLNKDNNTWSMPGGSVETGENLEQAIIRETKEETGLDVKPNGIVAVNERVSLKKQHHTLFFTFSCEIIGGQICSHATEEIGSILWKDMAEAEDLLPYFNGNLSRLTAGCLAPYINHGVI